MLYGTFKRTRPSMQTCVYNLGVRAFQECISCQTSAPHAITTDKGAPRYQHKRTVEHLHTYVSTYVCMYSMCYGSRCSMVPCVPCYTYGCADPSEDRNVHGRGYAYSYRTLTINLLEISELFWIFNSHFSKFRRKYALFCSHLVEIRAFCKIGGVLCRHRLESSVNWMAAAGSFFITVSCVICRYHVYKEVWSPSIGENFICSITGSSYPVISTLDDISKRNTASLGAITNVRYYFARCIMQYPGNHYWKSEVYTNFRVTQEFKILERFKAKSEKVCKNLTFEV